MKTHSTFPAPAAKLIAAEISQALELRTPFFLLLKNLGSCFIPTSLPCGAQKCFMAAAGKNEKRVLQVLPSQPNNHSTDARKAIGEFSKIDLAEKTSSK